MAYLVYFFDDLSLYKRLESHSRDIAITSVSVGYIDGIPILNRSLIKCPSQLIMYREARNKN